MRIGQKLDNEGKIFALHKGQPVMIHEIKIVTPIDEELIAKVSSGEKGNFVEVYQDILKVINSNIEDKLMDTFESDIASIYSYTRGPILKTKEEI